MSIIHSAMVNFRLYLSSRLLYDSTRSTPSGKKSDLNQGLSLDSMSNSTTTEPRHPPTAPCAAQTEPHLPAVSQVEAQSNARPELLRALSRIQRQEAILRRRPAPSHWKADNPTNLLGVVRRAIFNLLCITSFGHAGLEPIWASIKLEEEGDESVWAEGIRQTTERLNNMLIVAGLLLATAAVFITTEPPRATIVDYTRRGPYICMLGAFGLLIGGIIVASVSVLVAGKARPYWSEDVLYANRAHVYCTLIMLSYPFFTIGVATLLLAFGVLSAVWTAQDHGIQAAAVLLLILPISMAFLFAVSCATAKAKSRLRKDNAQVSSHV